MAEKKMSFEAAMRELESVVTALETGSASLDDSLALYEKGMKLVRVCNAALKTAERRIEAVRLTPNGAVTEPLEGNETDDEH